MKVNKNGYREADLSLVQTVYLVLADGSTVVYSGPKQVDGENERIVSASFTSGEKLPDDCHFEITKTEVK